MFTQTLQGGTPVEGVGGMDAQGSGEDILDVGGQDHVAVVLVCLQVQCVEHVHQTNDGLKRLRRHISCKKFKLTLTYMFIYMYVYMCCLFV